jgi:hypothetical protein
MLLFDFIIMVDNAWDHSLSSIVQFNFKRMEYSGLKRNVYPLYKGNYANITLAGVLVHQLYV